MRCILADGFGPIDEKLRFAEDVEKPQVAQKNDVLLRVLACAIAPGDVRVLSGDTDRVQSPGKFPYIPGSDVCGVVEESLDEKWKPGDCVIARFEAPKPRDGLAEYMVVQSHRLALKPGNLSPVEAAALGSSVVAALLMSEMVTSGERVLVLGGSGGVGSHIVQLLHSQGASFVAATSTQTELLKSLGVDRPIDYRKENWWELEELKEKPVDLILDLVAGKSWQLACESGVLKRKTGRFLASMPDNHWPVIHSLGDQMKIGLPIVGRMLWSRINPSLPSYSVVELTNPKQEVLVRLCKLVEDANLKIVLDPSCPVPFNEEAVKKAFHLQRSRHAHGKIVVEIAKE